MEYNIRKLCQSEPIQNKMKFNIQCQAVCSVCSEFMTIKIFTIQKSSDSQVRIISMRKTESSYKDKSPHPGSKSCQYVEVKLLKQSQDCNRSYIGKSVRNQ